MVSPSDLSKGAILLNGDTIKIKQNNSGGWINDDTEKPVALYMAYLQDPTIKEKLKISDYWLGEYKKVHDLRPDIIKNYMGTKFKIYKMINKYYAEEI